MKNTLNGLVLAGGKSSRMGKDKSSLFYHPSLNQRTYLFRILSHYCSEVWISCQQHQADEWQDNLPYLIDCYEEMGPLAGILSAFKQNPQSAWLVIACDMPFVNSALLEFLIQNRNQNYGATTFLQHQRIEPLCTIWEISALPWIEEAIRKQNFSPLSILQAMPTYCVPIPEQFNLKNVNEWEEYTATLNHSDFQKCRDSES